jgi:hypothetical protein
VSGDIAVWWRDDDAGRFDARLDRLIELAADSCRAIGLAVVPAWLDAKTERLLRSAPHVQVLQHGWAHLDHAVSGQKSIELGGTADPSEYLIRLQQGRARLEGAFGDRFVPVIVPPWNRIDEAFLSSLARLGFRGISTYADDARGTAHRLIQVNAHIDLIDWRGTRRMKPLAQLVDELEIRLAHPERKVVGLLSHHLNMNLDEMARLRQLLRHVDRTGQCRWTNPADLFLSA